VETCPAGGALKEGTAMKILRIIATAVVLIGWQTFTSEPLFAHNVNTGLGDPNSPHLDKEGNGDAADGHIADHDCNSADCAPPDPGPTPNPEPTTTPGGGSVSVPAPCEKALGYTTQTAFAADAVVWQGISERLSQGERVYLRLGSGKEVLGISTMPKYLALGTTTPNVVCYGYSLMHL